jgi:tRNA threonylcarbamoyladenosine biosynthesis protein TsaE
VTGIVETSSEEETSAIGEALAGRLADGDLIAIHGALGAGKTAFVRGLARGLGIRDDDVSSPTFTLIQEYRGRLTLYHVDLYRLEAEREVEELGLDDLLLEGVVAIEWAERWRDRPAPAHEVRIEDLGGDRRRVTIAAAT